MNIPVLLGLKGEAEDIILKEKVGLSFTPEDYASFLGALKRLEENPFLIKSLKKNAQIAYQKYDRKTKALEMLSSLENLVIEDRDS